MLNLLALNGGALLTALLIAYAVGAHARASLFALTTLCGFLIVIHSAVLATGLVGWLTPGGAGLFVGLTAVGAAWLARRLAPVVDDERPVPFTPASAFVPFLALLTGFVWAWPHLFEATRFWTWDDYSYHAVYPTLWLREHAVLAPQPATSFTLQAWYPLSASVVSLWFMIPFAASRADAVAWVSLTGLLYVAIVASATAELLARLGCRRGAWGVAAVLIFTSERIGTMASSFSDSDLAHATAIFAAFVLVMPRRDRETTPEIAVDSAFAALMSGLAIGIKVSAAPVAIVLLSVMLVRARSHTTLTRSRAVPAGVVLIFGAAWLVTAAYWYARNIVHTGNPVFPVKFLFWPGGTLSETTLVEYAQRYGVARTVRDSVAVYMKWDYFHGVLAVAGLAGLAIWLVARRSGTTRPHKYFVRSAVAITIVVLGLLPTTPWSAGNAMSFRAGFIHWDSMRYVAVLPMLGWAALGFMLDAGARAAPWRMAVAAAITTAAVLMMEYPRPYAVSLLVVAIIFAAIATRIRWPGSARRAAVLAGSAAVVLLAMVIVTRHPQKARATAAWFHEEPLYGAMSTLLDRYPAGTRVAIFGDQWSYPLFGDRHHLVPVRVDHDGRVATTPMTRFTQDPLSVHPWTFGANLAASRIDLVIVLHLTHPGRSAEWASQTAALDAIGNARVVFRGQHGGIWKVEK